MLALLLLSSYAAVTSGGTVHIDIEPHSLPEWNSGDRDGIALEWLSLIEQMDAALTNRCNLTVDVAMAYSLDAGMVTRDGDTKLLLYHVLDIVDSVVVMAYRNFALSCEFVDSTPEFQSRGCPPADSILSHSKLALDIAATYPAHSKAVGIGVETNPTVVPSKTTFGALNAGEQAMELAFNEVVAQFGPPSGAYPGLDLGLAVHDYSNWNSTSFLRPGVMLDPQQRWCRSMWLWDTGRFTTSPTVALSDPLVLCCISCHWLNLFGGRCYPGEERKIPTAGAAVCC